MRFDCAQSNGSVPTLLGGEQDSHAYLFWSYGAKKAVRQGKWKAVIPGQDQPLELYDLENDIGEQQDLAQQHPQQVARMKQMISDAMQK